MSLEAWGDEGDLGPEGYVHEEMHQELQEHFDELLYLLIVMRNQANFMIEAHLPRGATESHDDAEVRWVLEHHLNVARKARRSATFGTEQREKLLQREEMLREEFAARGWPFPPAGSNP